MFPVYGVGVVDGVTEVDDSPIDVWKDGGVKADDVTIGEAIGRLQSGGRAVVDGVAEDEFAIGLDGEDGNLDGDARAQEAVVDVSGEIAAAVDGDIERADVIEAEIEAEGSAELPVLIGKTAFFSSGGAVDGEPGLSVEVCINYGDKDQSKELKISFRHGSRPRSCARSRFNYPP